MIRKKSEELGAIYVCLCAIDAVCYSFVAVYSYLWVSAIPVMAFVVSAYLL